jgi:hypothetical protein
MMCTATGVTQRTSCLPAALIDSSVLSQHNEELLMCCVQAFGISRHLV